MRHQQLSTRGLDLVNKNIGLHLFCIMSDNEILPEDRPSTWSSRNPEKSVIQPRVQLKKAITAAQKISNAEKRAMKHDSTVAFQQVINGFNHCCGQVILQPCKMNYVRLQILYNIFLNAKHRILQAPKFYWKF